MPKALTLNVFETAEGFFSKSVMIVCVKYHQDLIFWGNGAGCTPYIFPLPKVMTPGCHEAW